MSSRDKILAAVKLAQPEALPLPIIEAFGFSQGDVNKFKIVLESIGGKMYEINKLEDVEDMVSQLFPEANRIISSTNGLKKFGLPEDENFIHHSLQDVDVAIIGVTVSSSRKWCSLGSRRRNKSESGSIYLPAFCGSGRQQKSG